MVSFPSLQNGHQSDERLAVKSHAVYIRWPVRSFNFQDVKEGGLGLIHPLVKSKAFFLKNMKVDFQNLDNDKSKIKNLTGWKKEFELIVENNLLGSDIKTIYRKLLETSIKKNGSLIPSRNEKRTRGIKWRVTWRNLSLLKGLSPADKCFGWKMVQDLVEVGARLHRRGAHRECSRIVDNGVICNGFETLEHRLCLCKAVQPLSDKTLIVLEWMLDKSIDRKELICLNITARKQSTLCICLWFIVKAMVALYNNVHLTQNNVFREIEHEILWNLNHDIVIGSKIEMGRLRSYLLRIL